MGRNQNRQRRQRITDGETVKQVLRDFQEMGSQSMTSDRDVAFYCRGWNMALNVAIGVLQDFVMLKEDEKLGMGMAQQAPR